MKALRVIDTFSGIGGFTLAGEMLGGFETVSFVEREPFCQKILHKHWPHIPIHNDIRTFEPRMGAADVICGGFPCQDISLAGKQAGIKQGTRSGLFYELLRVVCLVRPRFVVLENVAGILSNGIDVVLGELSKAGFDAEWSCIPASAVGACHQRDRWWLVAYPSSKRCDRKEEEVFAGRDTITGNDFANTTSEQCNVRQSANTKKQTRVAGEFGNSNGTSASNTNNSGSQRLRDKLELQQSSRQIQAAWCHQPRMPEPDWRRFVSKPVLRRGDDGLSGRVDRLKSLGNAVVPQVAQIPLARVLQLANEQQTASLLFK